MEEYLLLDAIGTKQNKKITHSIDLIGEIYLNISSPPITKDQTMVTLIRHNVVSHSSL